MNVRKKIKIYNLGFLCVFLRVLASMLYINHANKLFCTKISVSVACVAHTGLCELLSPSELDFSVI